MRRIVLWAALALLGLALTVAATVAVGSLSTQTFAIQGEPLERSDALAPPGPSSSRGARRPAPDRTPTIVAPATTTTRAETPTTPATTTRAPGSGSGSGLTEEHHTPTGGDDDRSGDDD